MTGTVKTNKIAFQGDYGANSDTACRNMFATMEPLPCATFEDAFQAVENAQADLAMIPIENTLAGRVADIHHLLPHSSLYIVGEYFLPIHFQLMALPGVRLEEIESVHSHIHALGQCRNIIRRHGWRAMVAGDTAGAAKMIAEKGDRSMAALAPTLAAQLYGLDILERDVHDSQGNITRFIILAREENRPALPLPTDKHKMIISSLLFRVRNVPAALYKTLGGFATSGINVTKLESYQIGGTFTATQFYIDIEGHPEKELVRLALEELAFFSDEWRIIGVYEGAPQRSSHSF